jgi:hypothetical protein
MTASGAQPLGAGRVGDMLVDSRRGRRNGHHPRRAEDGL